MQVQNLLIAVIALVFLGCSSKQDDACADLECLKNKAQNSAYDSCVKRFIDAARERGPYVVWFPDDDPWYQHTVCLKHAKRVTK